MKLVILSDIHSNWDYLQSISESISLENADYIFNLGDSIGYYNNSNEVLKWLKENNVISIKGNHEKMLLREIGYNPDLEKIYNLKKIRNELTDELHQFISTWPDFLDITIESRKIYLQHSLISNNKYSYLHDIRKIDKKFIEGKDYFIFGHTHIPIISYHYGCCVINPGAVGQPRDYTKMPSFVVIDLNTNVVQIKKVQVDFKKLIKKLHNERYNSDVIDILGR